MELVGLGQCRSVPLSLLGQDVEDDRLILGLEELESADQERDVMPVDRTVIAQAKVLEDHAGEQDLLHARLYLVGEMTRGLAPDPLDELRGLLVQMGVGRTGGDAVEVFGDGPGVPGDRPLVVIEHHDEFPRGLGDIVERLVTHAAGEGRITGHGDDMLAPPVHVARGGHPQRRRKGGAGMTRSVAVVLALGAQQEPVESAMLAHRRKTFTATRQDLVDVALVADIEEDPVRGGLEDAVQGYGEFDHPEIGTEMSACLGKRGDEFLADLKRKAGEILFGKLPEIVGRVDPVEQSEGTHDSGKGSSEAAPRLVRVMISMRLSAASSFSRQIPSRAIPSS